MVFYAMDAAGLSNYEPQVLIRGGRLKKVVIYIDMPAPENGMKTRQEVPLTEVSLSTSMPAHPTTMCKFTDSLLHMEAIVLSVFLVVFDYINIIIRIVLFVKCLCKIQGSFERTMLVIRAFILFFLHLAITVSPQPFFVSVFFCLDGLCHVASCQC